MKKFLLLFFLIFLFLIPACGSGGGGGSNSSGDNASSSLTLAQKIEQVQTEAAAKGCTVIDTNTNYSILAGGENSEGNNYLSRQGDQTGALETLPTHITVNCNGQNINFIFADDTTQSGNVLKANEDPVGDINAFFKSDKKTAGDVEAFIREQLNATSLCRFAIFPAFTGTIGESATEALTVGVSGKDCLTPQWYINGSSTPAGTGNTLTVGTSNLTTGENDITVKVTNPAGTNALYLIRTRGTAGNNPATAIDVSITPTDVYSTTPSITGSETVTDPDGGTVITRQWYDNSVLKSTGSATYTGPFISGHTISYKATADGVVSDVVYVVIKNAAAQSVTASINSPIYKETPIVCSYNIVDPDGFTNVGTAIYLNGVEVANGVLTSTVAKNKGDKAGCYITADDKSSLAETTVLDTICSATAEGYPTTIQALTSKLFTVNYTDIDGDKFTGSVIGLPPGSIIEQKEGGITVYLVPGSLDVGVYSGIKAKFGTVGAGGCTLNLPNMEVTPEEGPITPPGP